MTNTLDKTVLEAGRTIICCVLVAAADAISQCFTVLAQKLAAQWKSVNNKYHRLFGYSDQV